jgi:hypothetical protein
LPGANLLTFALSAAGLCDLNGQFYRVSFLLMIDAVYASALLAFDLGHIAVYKRNRFFALLIAAFDPGH